MDRATRRVLYSGLAYLLGLGLILIGGAVFGLLLAPRGVTLTQYAMFATPLSIGVAALALTLALGRGRGLRLCSPGWSALLIVPLSLLVYLTISYATGVWIAVLQLIGAKSISSPAEQLVPDSASGLVLSLFVTGILPGVCEEWLFRGGILPGLEGGRQRFRGAAFLLCSISFSLMHGSLAALPGHVLLGLFLTWLCIESRSIFVPVIAHAANNSFAILLSFGMQRLLPYMNDQALGALSSGDMFPAPALQMLSFCVLVALFGGLSAGLYFLWRHLRRRELAVRPPRPGSQTLLLPGETPQRARAWAYIPYWLGLAGCAALYLADTVRVFFLPGLS